MARPAHLEKQSLREIAEYHNDVVDSLPIFLRSALEKQDIRFLGLTPVEFEAIVSGRIRETELRSTLAILAAVEATLRVDYQRRVEQRLKDPLSKAFRKIRKDQRSRLRFDEDLLELWRQHHPDQKNLVSELRAALHFRHWLAHGRYWEMPSSGRFDYLSMYTLADLILVSFPLLV
jgi:hypothetical protein